ncbi:terminase large subunit [Mesorhizobium sp. BR1-1-12]|uniref:terminase large subunit n=1 Tax=Mesorhizobium sp. BR1-1-12 TaxID=2876657 RepID=UPI001CD08EB8|nr:terminase TerL endonuclease subunit [Mesorhizobium sp. BR1-1-12]MBZ9973497.1 terminase large subunit [Mesorhizobium sp. BR1-1-12]
MATKRSQAKSSSAEGLADPVTAYANAVMSGDIVAGPHVRNACRRHLDDLKNGHERGLYFDVAAAHDILKFCRTVCKLKDGQFDGKPFIPHASQEFILGSLYGWKKADGFRRFRRAYIEIGKGNGKSPMAAAIGLYGLVADGEAGAEIYAAGKDKAQAFVLFRDAVSMVRQSKLLTDNIVPSGGTGAFVENLAYLKTGSFFRVISREGASSGPRPTVALCDELHEHPSSDVIEMLERGFKARRQPLLVMITNSGFDRSSVCWVEHKHACSVAAGVPKELLDEDATYVGDVIDDTSFSYVCALDKDDDPFTDPSCWIKANPMLGVILTHEYMEKNVAQARDIPSKRGNILRLHFCVWTESETTWIPRPLVERVMEVFDPYEIHKGKRIKAAGLDLSGKIDLTAAAFVVETGGKEVVRADGETVRLPTYDAWIEAWTPRDTMDERAKVSNLPYRQWYNDGYVRAPEGASIRFDHVAALFAKVHAEQGIDLLAYDRYRFDEFENELADYGCDIKCVMHPQGGKRRAKPDQDKVDAAKAAGEEAPLGLWMPGSLAALETLILEERIRIRRSPVILAAIMAAHVETEPEMGNQLLSKKKSTQKIDPAVALCMAVGAAVDGAPEPPPVSPWNDPAFSLAQLGAF